MRRLSIVLDSVAALRAAAGADDADIPACTTLAELAGADAVQLGVSEELRPVSESDVRQARRAGRLRPAVLVGGDDEDCAPALDGHVLVPEGVEEIGREFSADVVRHGRPYSSEEGSLPSQRLNWLFSMPSRSSTLPTVWLTMSSIVWGPE